jgi:hypothetical protein
MASSKLNGNNCEVQGAMKHQNLRADTESVTLKLRWAYTRV